MFTKRQLKVVGDVYVATCDEKIASVIDKNGGRYILTKDTILVVQIEFMKRQKIRFTKK